MRLAENTIADFLGLQENDSPLVVKSGSRISCYSSKLDSLRPNILEKVKGCALHSAISYKMADRPVTLLRYCTDGGTKRFIATAWDNILKYSAGWVPLLSESSIVNTATGYLVPSNLLYGVGFGIAARNGVHTSYVNRPFDYLTYKDTLYLTDGYNLPVKILSVSPQTVGSWGYRQFTNATPPILTAVQAAGGTLAADTYNYKGSLYDTTRTLEGNAGSVLKTQANAGIFDIWVYINKNVWTADNNYDYENAFASRVRIYRSPCNVGDNAYRLAGTIMKHITSGTCEVAVGGNVVAVGTKFSLIAGAGALPATNRPVLYGGVIAYMVDNITDDEHCHVVKSDGSAVGAGEGVAAGSECHVLGGFLDTTTNISANTLYHEEDTTLDVELRDHSAPPRCKYCVMFGALYNRAFMAGDADHPNRLYWSAVDYPDYFPLENYWDIDPDDGDHITALVKFHGKLIISKERSASIMLIEGDRYSWQLIPGAISVGTIDTRLIADCDGTLIFVNSAGVWSYDGSKLSYISHNENGSNIRKSWDNVVKTKLEDIRVVFHEKRNEFWMSVTLDDERGLYDSTLTDYGNITIHRPDTDTKVASDDSGHPQNNGTFVYRLDDGQWFYISHKGATAWCVLNATGDELQLYRGNYHCAVWNEDIGETIINKDGYSGQCTGAAPNPTYSFRDAGASWTIDEWAGGTIYVHHYANDTTESAVIVSNTATTINIRSAGGAEIWTSNPTSGDYYILTKDTSASGFDVRWRTPMLVIDSFRLGKWFIELLLRLFGTGSVTFSWSIDGGEKPGGTFQVNTTQATTFWGLNNWANVDSEITGGDGHSLEDTTASWVANEWRDYWVWLLYLDGTVDIRQVFSNNANSLTVTPDWTIPLEAAGVLYASKYEIYDDDTLIFTALGQLLSEFNFPETAEGKMIELEITATPSQTMYVTLLSLGYKLHTGEGWRP